MNHTVPDPKVGQHGTRDLVPVVRTADTETKLVLTQHEIDLVHALATEIISRLGSFSSLPGTGDEVITTGSLAIYPSCREATVSGKAIDLKPRGFALLLALAHNLGRVLSRDQLLEMAWPDPEGLDDNRTVDGQIRRLRMRLGSASDLIQTIAGTGYKLARVPNTRP